MNKTQKIVQQTHLEEEKRILKQLKQVYAKAQDDCTERILDLSRRRDMENLQSIIYQRQYQEVLKRQLDGLLDNLQGEEFTSISEYLEKCYYNGYIGTMYDIHSQGIPIIMPINQEQVVQALKTDSKLSKSLYDSLGEDVNYLKKSIRAELSRGTANGSTWNEMAEKIAKGMNSPFKKAYNRAVVISRTEGHRIQQKSALDAQYAAKEKGADIVKQWDATLDNRTRPHHRRLDGQLRELEEPFELEGMKADAPGYFGKPKEDCNCRCCLLQRARWALDEEELEELKKRAAYFGLDKTKDFDDFKKKYLKLPDNADTIKTGKVLDFPVKSDDEYYSALLTKLEEMKVKYNPVKNHAVIMTDDEIISALSGGDRTSGSCASLGLAYIGQRQGYNVLDFRGGDSQNFFSNGINLFGLSNAKGLNVLRAEGKSSMTVGSRLLKQCESGKEYYLAVGKHAAIVRKLEDGTFQYLELQSATKSGWTNFDRNLRSTLHTRFGCTPSVRSFGDFMIDINDSDFSTDEFRSLLGFINTAEDMQRKGKYGTIK